MKHLTISEYLKQFCHNRFSEFVAKNLPCTYSQTPYTDDRTYIDAENGIQILDSYYICD